MDMQSDPAYGYRYVPSGMVWYWSALPRSAYYKIY